MQRDRARARQTWRYGQRERETYRDKQRLSKIDISRYEKQEERQIETVSSGVMVSMLGLWAGGPKINTWSGTFNCNHYVNRLRHI